MVNSTPIVVRSITQLFPFSYRDLTPVARLIGERIALTVVIAMASILFTWIIAVTADRMPAVRQYSIGDYADDYRLLDGVEEPEVTFEASPGHFQEWVRAIKGGQPATSNFAEYAGPLTETILLGNLAVWVGEGKKIEWDSESLSSPNMPEVASIVKREYREGYTL